MKYALVTGGSRGIGRAICIELARSGFPVIINYKTNQEAAEETLSAVEALGVSGELLPFDVTSKDEVEAALDAWELAHPDDYVSVLVNNAGIRRDNVMFMMSDEEWSDVLRTSLDSFFYITRIFNINIS